MKLDAAGAAEVLRKYDKPGLDLSEFSRLVHDVVAWQVGAGAPAPTAGAVAAAFGRADADNSGYVELGELRFALDALGLRVSADGAAAILARYEHGSGVDVITFGELVRDVLAWHFEATREAATAAGRVEAAFGRFDTDRLGQDRRSRAAGVWLPPPLNHLHLLHLSPPFHHPLCSAPSLLGHVVELAVAAEVVSRHTTDAPPPEPGLNLDEFAALVRDLIVWQEGRTADELVIAQRGGGVQEGGRRCVRGSRRASSRRRSRRWGSRGRTPT